MKLLHGMEYLMAPTYLSEHNQEFQYICANPFEN